MVFWIIAAIVIFLCSLIWAYISVRQISFPDHAASAADFLPPQPKRKNLSSQTVATVTPPLHEVNTGQDEMPSGSALSLETGASDPQVADHTPLLSSQKTDAADSVFPSITTPQPTAMPSFNTVEDARRFLHEAANKAKSQLEPKALDQAPRTPPVIANAAPELKPTMPILTIKSRAALGKFLGEITISGRA